MNVSHTLQIWHDAASCWVPLDSAASGDDFSLMNVSHTLQIWHDAASCRVPQDSTGSIDDDGFSLMNVSTHYRSDMMQHRVEFHWVLLILVMMVCAPQAKKQESSYPVLRKGQSVRGNIAAEFKAESFEDCSVRQVRWLNKFSPWVVFQKAQVSSLIFRNLIHQ